MNFIGIIILLCIMGIGLWIIPMEATIKKIIIGIVALVVVLWLFQEFGFIGHFNVIQR